VGKTTVIYVNFLRDVACQKLLKSANVSRSIKKITLAQFFLRHGVYKSPWSERLQCMGEDVRLYTGLAGHDHLHV